ncbi:hypothetical protein OG21DRAFT_920901 [Imleria badia]|nr:hypothetical protein OG21DRAFT_920901 [Imleria badia]
MWTIGDFPRAAKLVLVMLDKGWFDDAVGRVEGSKILKNLMASDDLRKEIVTLDIVAMLERKLEIGDCNEIRMILICVDILWNGNSSGKSSELSGIVTNSLARLRDKDVKIQKRGVKTLSSLAQTEAGEKVIHEHVIEIVKMLLPRSDGSRPPYSQLFGPTAAVYNLCKNETLRHQIQQSKEFAEFKLLRHDGALFPQTRATRSMN